MEWRKGFLFYYYPTNVVGIVDGVVLDGNYVDFVYDAFGNDFSIDKIIPATDKQAKEMLEDLDRKLGEINIKRHIIKEWLLYSDEEE